MDPIESTNNKFHFFPDQPASEKDDILEDTAYAARLVDTLLNYSDEKSIVFGLSGPGGAGKSTIMGMSINQIREQTRDWPVQEKPIIMRFMPWNFSEQNQLIRQFFNQLSLELGRKDHRKAAKYIGEVMEAYANFVELVPGAGAPVKMAVSGVGRYLKGWGSAPPDLNRTKDQLNDYMKKKNRKVIIFIDEVDQLTNAEIRQIFHLVKSMADFTNTIYLLAYDRSVVTRALASVQEEKGTNAGELYLGKVVQVPFEVPLVSSKELEELLFSRLDEFLKNLPQGLWDHSRWAEVYYGDEDLLWHENGNKNGFHSLFKSFRDVKRYVNALSLSFGMVMEEYHEIEFPKVNPVDFLALTAIQVFHHPFYSWIRNNKELLTGMYENQEEKESSEQTFKDNVAWRLLEEKEREEDTLRGSIAWAEKRDMLKMDIEQHDCDYQILLNILKKLFPKTDPECQLLRPEKEVKEESKIHERVVISVEKELDRWRHEYRICSPEIFETYFKLLVPEEDRIRRFSGDYGESRFSRLSKKASYAGGH